jgi:hypothetical protein
VHETIRENKLDFFAILETGRSNFSVPFLKHLSGGQDYIWYCLPPQGRSGGILVGINSATLSVSRVTNGNFYIKLHLKSKCDGFEWVLVPVYGAAHEDKKANFLAELVRTCDNEDSPLLIGGDFNILRRKKDKNNENFNGRWPFMFNAIIESLDLREIALLSGRQLTWANRRETPTFEKLDRFLASVEWKNKFTLVTVRALTRSRSDHTPLLIDSGEQAHLGNKFQSSFELSWLPQEGFFNLVREEWNRFGSSSSPMENWQTKIIHVTSFLRGWAKN